MFPAARVRQATWGAPSSKRFPRMLGHATGLRVCLNGISGFVSGLMIGVIAAWKLSPLLLSLNHFHESLYDSLDPNPVAFTRIFLTPPARGTLQPNQEGFTGRHDGKLPTIDGNNSPSYHHHLGVGKLRKVLCFPNNLSHWIDSEWHGVEIPALTMVERGMIVHTDGALLSGPVDTG